MLRRVTPSEARDVHELLLDNGRWLLSRGIDQWPIEWLESLADPIRQSVEQGLFWCVDSALGIEAVVEL